MNTFFAMGDYGWFVWSSLGLCALTAMLELFSIRRRFRLAWQRVEQEAQARTHEACERQQP